MCEREIKKTFTLKSKSEIEKERLCEREEDNMRSGRLSVQRVQWRREFLVILPISKTI